MRSFVVLVLSCVAIGFAAADPAQAQYPGYGLPTYGQYPAVRSQHHHHHCLPTASTYASGYAATGYGAPIYAPPVLPYPPTAGYPSLYGAPSIYGQPVLPQSSNVYSNTYYGLPGSQARHGWHLGHYLLGN
jgi:hypothetical protein